MLPNVGVLKFRGLIRHELWIGLVMPCNSEHDALASGEDHSYRPQWDLQLDDVPWRYCLAFVVTVDYFATARKLLVFGYCVRRSQESLRTECLRNVDVGDLLNGDWTGVVKVLHELAIFRNLSNLNADVKVVLFRTGHPDNGLWIARELCLFGEVVCKVL